MANKTCMRCGMLMDEFDTDCPCDDPDFLIREATRPEPRASVMPPNVAPIDPAFLRAVSEYAPDESSIEEKE